MIIPIKIYVHHFEDLPQRSSWSLSLSISLTRFLSLTHTYITHTQSLSLLLLFSNIVSSMSCSHARDNSPLEDRYLHWCTCNDRSRTSRLTLSRVQIPKSGGNVKVSWLLSYSCPASTPVRNPLHLVCHFQLIRLVDKLDKCVWQLHCFSLRPCKWIT